eukprot:773838-Amphidinium_carterae.1
MAAEDEKCGSMEWASEVWTHVQRGAVGWKEAFLEDGRCLKLRFQRFCVELQLVDTSYPQMRPR